MAIARFAGLILFAVVSGQTPSTAPATTRATLASLDLATWTQRNVDVIAEAARAAIESPSRRSEFDTAAGFSVQFNPALADDNARMAEIAAIVDRVNATTRPADAATWMTTFAKMPHDERRLRQILGIWTDDKGSFEPLVDAGNAFNLATHLGGVPERDYDRLAAPMLDDLDAQCHAVSKWDGLELVYSTVAFDALRRGNAARANRYIDRMLALLRAHPDFQTHGGNTRGVIPSTLGLLMSRAGRVDDCLALSRVLQPPMRAQVVAGLIGAALDADRVDEARRLISGELPAEDAARLASLLDTRVPATTPAVAPMTHSTIDAMVAPYGSIEASIARYHATHGRIDVAGSQFGATQAAPSHYWNLAGLAAQAGDSGNAAAARAGFEVALNAYAEQEAKIDSPGEIAEKSWFVRRFAELGEYRTAAQWLSTSTPPGATARLQLASIYRRRGEIESARANLRQVVQLGDAPYSKEGGAMAAAAVELNDLGEPAEAERVLLASLSHIRGEDFSFGGTADVIRAARRMNRLDLLDRLYNEGKPGERLLLSLCASSRAWYEANNSGATDEDN